MKIYREVGTLKLITQCDKEGYARPVYEIEVDEAEPIRHGHWEDIDGDGSIWKCSVCGEIQCCNSNYCGDCGAKMDEVTK